ncbi:homoserine acetyltransferase [Phlebopus sp. FC_14]|nr:homoserine acetyltransferase [Phlebopus sp. FC_14]
MADQTLKYHHHGRFQVAGGVLPDAVTAYQTFGDPANPCVVAPTYYGGKLALGGGLMGPSINGHRLTRVMFTPPKNIALDMLAGEGKTLDTKKYYVVTFASFCNGESSSPSNTSVPYNGPYFPAISYEDNVRAQYAVVTNVLGIKKVYCVAGFSMAGQQAYYWATMYPDFVDKIAVVVSSARTSEHSRCIMEGPIAALTASKDFEGGNYTSTPQHGMRAFGRVLLAWVHGQTWYREHKYLKDGQHPDLMSFIREEAEGTWLQHWDANDMLALMKIWQTGDISLVRHNGDYEKALKSIEAEVLLVPSSTDLFFPPEDSKIELSLLKKAKLVLLETNWGHSGQSPEDFIFACTQVEKFLAGAI